MIKLIVCNEYVSEESVSRHELWKFA